MALLPAGQADLLLPLVASSGDAERWEAFLGALITHTRAQRAILMIAPAMAAPGLAPVAIERTAPSAADQPPIGLETLTGLGLQSLRALRPGRVYALEELLDYSDPARLESQRNALAAQGVGFARLTRVAAGKAGEAWVVLLRAREDFGAGVAALLSSLAPILGAALRAAAAFGEERAARSLAEDTLSRLGIGQLALDAAGRVLAADPVARGAFDIIEAPDERTGRRLALPPAAAERVERCCAAFAAAAKEGGTVPDPVVIVLENRPALLLRPALGVIVPHLAAQPAAIAALRLPGREDERPGAAVLRDLYQLSPREAALAEKLSRGETIVDAGRALRLTAETARNYSKRIYARTGTRGAPDLVRTILTGLAPLA